MLTLNEIAKELCESYSRVAGAYKRAGVTPIGNVGRTLLFNEADIVRIKEVLAKTPHRKKAEPKVISPNPIHSTEAI